MFRSGRPTDPATVASYEFISTILQWDLSSFDRTTLSDAVATADTSTLERLPTRLSPAEIHTYYNNFIPFIFEETRATISQGLEQRDRRKAVQVKLKVQEFMPARREENPARMKMHGKLPTSYDQGTSCIVLLLQFHDLEILALADYFGDYFNIKAFFNRPELRPLVDNPSLRAFSAGAVWQGYVLGSVITQMRMYIACKTQIQFPCFRQVLTGESEIRFEEEYDEDEYEPLYRYGYRSYSTATIELPDSCSKLNDAQRLAVSKFLSMPQGLQLLQGPPGTGKTTTIVSLIAALCMPRSPTNRILVCAPSNKAVQVLATRLIELHPKIRSILVGVEGKLAPQLQPIFIHTWGRDILKNLNAIIDKLKIITAKNYKVGHFRNLVRRISQIQSSITHFLPSQTRGYHFEHIQHSYSIILDRGIGSLLELQQIIRYLTNIQTNIQSLHTTKDFSGSNLEKTLRDQAQVMFATLSVVGRRLMQETRIDILIVDEASQAVEPETLIPFSLQPQKVLLVGDTKQLPATVLSQKAVDGNFHWSMMWRLLEECEHPYDMLTVQHRMDPEICLWPSKQYYENRLENSEEVSLRRLAITKSNTILEPYSFINVDGRDEIQFHSFLNRTEALLIVDLIQYLVIHKKLVTSQIGVITFYAGQAALINHLLAKKFKGITVHTVDGFQGEEKDVIILSFVRANPRGIIGFLKDFRRLNVAITRAKNSLIMLGHANTLLTCSKSDVAKLVKNARARNHFLSQKQALTAIKKALLIPTTAKKTKIPIDLDATVATASKPKSSKSDLAKAETKDPRYKTALCHFFKPEAPRSCRFGDACIFAHGIAELRKNKKRHIPKPT